MESLTHVQRVRMLYKTILRLHRGLPVEIQSLGSSYVKDEFKRHKKCNEAEAAIFINEWTEYALMLANQLGLKGPHTAKPLGQDLDQRDFEKFRDEQVYQLYELMVAATVSQDDIYSWQKRVHNDATEFYSLCKHFDCYPDLWALYEWSNWLTPTVYSTKRFDTVFYMACLQNTPQTLCETSEIEDLKWDLPANFIFSAEGINLPTPQQYEIARIAKFESIDNLFDFVISRAKRGVSLVFPVKINLRDGYVLVMPGDSMYPKQVSFLEKQIIDKSDMTIEQFQDISPVKNRMECYNSNARKLIVQNFQNEDGHLMPMQLKYIRAIQNQKL